MTLSQLLIQYRKEHGLSQREFASRSGISNATISMLEKNLNPKTGEPIVPTIPNLVKIANAMGITMDELFSTVDDMPIYLNMPSRKHVPYKMFSGVGGINSSSSPSPDNELDRQIIDLFHSLPDADKMKALGYLQALSDK